MILTPAPSLLFVGAAVLVGFLQVKYNGSMCRISASKAANADIITYAGLVDRARSSFKFGPNDSLSFTYTDCDGDVINLASDQDIVDALVYQALNPLRVDLTVVKGEDTAPLPPAAAAAGATGAAPASDNWDADSVKTDSSEASFAAEAAKAKGAAASAAGANPTPSPTPAADSVKEVTDLVEKQLREALGVSEEVGKLMKTYEPLLRTAPGKIAEIFDAALKSGLSVSFEPILEPGSDCIPPDVKPGAKSASGSTAGATPAAAKATAAPAASSGDLKGTPARASSEEKVPEVAKGYAPGAPTSALADAVASAAAAVASTAAAVASTRKSAAAAAETAAKAASAASAGGAKTAPSASAAGAANGPVSYPVVHHGIICDGCDMNPLVGPRYKSLV